MWTFVTQVCHSAKLEDGEFGIIHVIAYPSKMGKLVKQQSMYICINENYRKMNTNNTGQWHMESIGSEKMIQRAY